MSMWLTLKLFGHGNGIAMPYFDGAFYWLVDDLREDRNAKNGRFYTWMSGFGAQLHSYEWRTPDPGTRRRLFGHTFEVFSVSRTWPLVRVAWGVVGGVDGQGGLDELRKDLLRFGM
jgi:hypothetical protein